MSDFPYLASVIVPVYNVEKYVAACLDSLVNQTVDFNKIEVVIVNDGTKDSSAQICQRYADKYENVFLYNKENEGLSKTRNYGLDRAHGKYIFYLDSDDTLRPDTIGAVTSFFDTVYDKTDLVTYRIIQYYQGRPAVVHFRYMTLTQSGVYDLNDPKNRFITQTNINICVKNMGADNIKFDTTPNFRHEDEKYCCDVLRRKMTIGFCAGGEYVYNRNNVDSIVSTQFSPENIFESSMEFYENLFSDFDGKVPPYYQDIVFNDFRWKLMDKKLLPLHLDDGKWLKANARIDRLLKMTDEDTIVLHPSVSEAHLHYWLMRRKAGHPTVLADEKGLTVCSDGRRICGTDRIIYSVKDGRARLDSVIFCHLNKSRFSVLADGEKVDIIFDNNYLNKNFNPDGTYPEFELKNPDAKLKLFVDGYEIRLIKR